MHSGACSAANFRRSVACHEVDMTKFEFIDLLASELAAIEHFKFEQLTQEAKGEYSSFALRALAALENLGVSVTPPDGKHYCVWCQCELPFPAEIPYIARKDTHICHNCVKHLSVVVSDQERRMNYREATEQAFAARPKPAA